MDSEWPPTKFNPHDPDWLRVPDAAHVAKLSEKTIRRKWRLFGVKYHGIIYISQSRLLRLGDQN